MQATGEVASNDAAKVLRKMGVKSHGWDATAGDQYLDAERTMPTRAGGTKPGFPSSVVPTLEEKTVAEHRPKDPESGVPILDALEDGQAGNDDTRKDPNGHAQNGHANAKEHEPTEARVETGELYGAPADASIDAWHDNQPPHARASRTDADSEEGRAPEARSTLRKHLTAKLGNKQWTLPTPTPHVDPYGFEDPICDQFWKDTWVASAAHNVSVFDLFMTVCDRC